MIDDFTLGKYQLYNYVFTLKIEKKYINHTCTRKWTNIHIHLINGHMNFFYDHVIFCTPDVPHATR